MLTVREDGRITVNYKFVKGKLNIYLSMNQHFSWESIFVVFVGNFLPMTLYPHKLITKICVDHIKCLIHHCHKPVNFCLYTNVNPYAFE